MDIDQFVHIILFIESRHEILKKKLETVSYAFKFSIYYISF